MRPPSKFGGEGHRLAATEHMFFYDTRIRTVREMILARTKRQAAQRLSKLLPMQRAGFVELFEIMKGFAVVTIGWGGFFHPPLTSSLPAHQAEIAEGSRAPR